MPLFQYVHRVYDSISGFFSHYKKKEGIYVSCVVQYSIVWWLCLQIPFSLSPALLVHVFAFMVCLLVLVL